jgi:hypothetical protein
MKRLRTVLGVVVPAVGVLLVVASCSSNSQSPAAVSSSPPPDSEPLRSRLSILLKVSNAHYGSAIPSDFTFTVTREAAPPQTLAGNTTPIEIAVPIGHQYSVAATHGPEGYTTQLSPGCSGIGDGQDKSCVITQNDIAVTCDEALWAPVYSKDRLRVLSACEVATGSVDAIEFARDGDLVIYLWPDGPYQKLLRPGNQKTSNRLVVEIPCQATIDQNDARGTCDKFQGLRIKVPSSGNRIVAAARWVEDKNHHNWGELHGARIVALPR